RPPVERSCRGVSENKRNVAPAHLKQILELCSAVRMSRKQARARRHVARELGDRFFVAAEVLAFAPTLDEKPVDEPERLGREPGRVQSARHAELAPTDAAEPGKFQQVCLAVPRMR